MSTFKNYITYLKRVRQATSRQFKMPEGTAYLLPQAWLAQIRLPSWPLASLIGGTVPYLFVLGLSIIDNPQTWFTGDWWRYGLLYPLMTIYILLLIPIFGNLLIKTSEAFLPLLPVTETGEYITDESYSLNRRREWLFFGLGAIAGWLITPFEDFSGFWQILYGLVGEGLNIGLLSWFAYNIVVGTKNLTALHNQTNGLNIPQSGILTPLSRWGVGISLAFLGGSLLSTLLLPQRNLLSPKNTIIYAILTMLVLVGFLRTSVSPSLIAQFRIYQSFALFTLVALTGTLGYYYLEKWDPLDGFYMTVITMTTIGYGEIGPLSPKGRIFTIILSLISVGIAGYAISAVAAFIFEGDFQKVIYRQKMNKRIANLKNHIILCGAGRVGAQIATEFHKTRTPFVLIEKNQAVLDEILRLGDIPYLLGDATKDETLRLARIDWAKGLVVTLPDDKENAFVVLSARSLNKDPNFRIVARLTSEENAEKLRKVGANEIVSPTAIGGLRMASVMIRPSVVSFLDQMMRSSGQTLRLEEVSLDQQSSLIGQTLAEANISEQTGLLVVAIKSDQGQYQFNPQGQFPLKVNDTLIVIGTPDQLLMMKDLGKS